MKLLLLGLFVLSLGQDSAYCENGFCHATSDLLCWRKDNFGGDPLICYDDTECATCVHDGSGMFGGCKCDMPQAPYCPLTEMEEQFSVCKQEFGCTCIEEVYNAIDQGVFEMEYGCITPQSGATFKQELNMCLYGVSEVVGRCFEDSYPTKHHIYPFDICGMSPNTQMDGYGYCYTTDDRWYVGDVCKQMGEYDNLCPYDAPEVGKMCWDTEGECYYGDWICCCDDCRQMQYVSCSDNGWISSIDASCSNGCSPVTHNACDIDMIIAISWNFSEEVQQACKEDPTGCLCYTTIWTAMENESSFVDGFDPFCYMPSGFTFDHEAHECMNYGITEMCIDIKIPGERCGGGTLFNGPVDDQEKCSEKAAEHGMISYSYRESNRKCIVPTNNGDCLEAGMTTQNGNWDTYHVYCELPECPVDSPSVTDVCVDTDLDCYYGDMVCCCDDCRPSIVVSCAENADFGSSWISMIDESCQNGCDPYTQPRCNLYLIREIGKMYPSPIPESCSQDPIGCDCYDTILSAVNYGLDFDPYCMMPSGLHFQEEAYHCEQSGDVDCEQCIYEFNMQDGCNCWHDPDCDQEALIPEHCFVCGEAAAEYCGIGHGCESGQICPGDNLCSGACAGGMDGSTCEDWMASLFESNQCYCSDGSAPCSSDGECQDGDVDDSDPCSPKHCSGGVWYYVMVDCAEWMGEICPSGWIPAAAGECCSTCNDHDGPTLVAPSQCENAMKICGGISFPGSTENAEAPSSNCYGVVDSQPNPAWFVFEAASDAPETISMQLSAMADIDHVVWGPFASIDDALSNCGDLKCEGESPGILDDNFDGGDTYVNFVLSDVSPGSVYLLLITNYAGMPVDIFADLDMDSVGALTCDGVPALEDDEDEAEPSCQNGIWNVGQDTTPRGVCCDSACGGCGGTGCSSFPGGQSKCCVGEIVRNGRYCEDGADTACIIPQPTDVGVVSFRFDLDFTKTCGDDGDILMFLHKCTQKLGDSRIWCHDCKEGSTIITVAGYKTVVEETAYNVVNRGQMEIEGYDVLPLIGTVETPEEVQQDLNNLYSSVDPVTPDAAEYSWTILFRQTVPYLYMQDEWSKNPNDPANDNYSILDQMEQYRQPDGRFYFRLTWPGDSNVFEWSQTSNPVEEAIAGYEPINVPYTAGGWGGLENGEIGRDTGPAALMDGSVGSDSYYYAVGLLNNEGWFQGGIPSYGKSNGDKTYPQNQVELYARVPAEDIICCEAMIASCLACKASMTVEEYCNSNPETSGCTVQTLYVKANLGEDCPSGYRFIDDLEQCENAMAVLGGMNGLPSSNAGHVIGDWSNHFKGCFLKTSNNYVHFNANDGTIDLNSQRYCETCDECRLRKSWTTMSEAERELYIDTILTITDATHANHDPALKIRYNEMVQMHQNEFNNGIHWAEEFLPWHRWYILKFEDLLREVEPCITVPFWAWELDAGNPDLHTNAYALWGTENWEFGSVVSPEGCVVDGPLGTFTLSDGASCLSRGQDGTFDDLVDIQTNVLSVPANDWEGFTNALEGAHDGVHCVIDGTMCTSSSAEDPLFFLHHVNIDRLWSLWQDKSNQHKNAQQFESNYNDPMIGVENNETPAHFTDLSDQYGGVCASYQDLSAAPEDSSNPNANAYHDVLTLLNEMPDDKDFWKGVAHTGELTLENAERFIKNVLVAGGMSEEEAEETAQNTLDRLGRTDYIEKRVVNDVKNVGVSTIEDVLAATLGTTTANLRERLVETGYTDEVAVLDFEAETLERKYTDRDVCDPNPCAHGATCTTGRDGSAQCECTSGYEGRSCAKDVCSPNPCENNGNCYVDPTSGAAACECASGYGGETCTDEYCSFEESTLCEECRCEPDNDHDYIEENLGHDGCLAKALAFGVPYFSLSVNDKCRVPTNDPQGQCVDNVEDYKGDWNTYEVTPVECPTTTAGSECEDGPIKECDECKCATTYSDTKYAGVTLQECFNWALFLEASYFSYTNNYEQKCRIPGEDAEDNCVTNRETDYVSEWDIYSIDICTTTPEPTECEGSYDQVCDECRCKTDYADIIVNPSTMEDCHELARDNGKSYFSFSSANKCRIPMSDDEEDQCVDEVESGKADWELYQLTECTTASPCERENQLICDECRCDPDSTDIKIFGSTVEDCSQAAIDNDKSYFSFRNDNYCRIPAGDEQAACVTNIELYKGDWDVYEITECSTQEPQCDDTYEVLCTECRCGTQYSDEVLTPSTLQQCFELAQSLNAPYFSFSVDNICRVPTESEEQHCVDDIENYKGDWTTYEIIDCDVTTTGEPCDTTPTEICTDCKCESAYGDFEEEYTSYEECLSAAQSANADYFWYHSGDNSCRYPGGDPEEQCVENIEIYQDGWITYSLTTCVTEEPCNPTSTAICEDCKCTKSAYIDDHKNNGMTAQECHDWAVSLDIYYYWYHANDNKCRIPATDAYDQCVENQDAYGNNWIIYQITPCNRMDTCPDDTSGLVGGHSCSQYLTGLQCGTGKDCCCGSCYDAKTLTCDGTVWQSVDNDHCENQSCSCQDVWPWKHECKTITRKNDCFAYYDKCAKSCGCDFDLEQARIDAGINDDAVESATCKTGNGFEDSRGFNCDVYEGAGWCAKDGNDVVEGDGWCKRWPRADYENVDEHHCRVMPGRNRMYTFGHYVNDDGLDARVCCCDTGKADEYQYDLGWGDNGGSCNDVTFQDGVAWHDKNGWTCRVYEFGNLCTAYGTPGSGWNNEWGSISDNGFIDMTLAPELDASDACCACGGGLTDPGYDDILPHLVKKITERFNKGFNERNFKRMRKHTQSVLDQDSMKGSHYDPSHISLVQSMNTIANKAVTNTNWQDMQDLWNNRSF